MFLSAFMLTFIVVALHMLLTFWPLLHIQFILHRLTFPINEQGLQNLLDLVLVLQLPRRIMAANLSKKILGIRKCNGTMKEELQEIRNVFGFHFQNIFSSQPLSDQVTKARSKSNRVAPTKVNTFEMKCLEGKFQKRNSFIISREWNEEQRKVSFLKWMAPYMNFMKSYRAQLKRIYVG